MGVCFKKEKRIKTLPGAPSLVETGYRGDARLLHLENQRGHSSGAALRKSQSQRVEGTGAVSRVWETREAHAKALRGGVGENVGFSSAEI